MGVTSGAGTSYSSGVPKFTPVFRRVAQSLLFCVVLCRPLSVFLYFFVWHIVLFVLFGFTGSDISFD